MTGRTREFVGRLAKLALLFGAAFLVGSTFVLGVPQAVAGEGAAFCQAGFMPLCGVSLSVREGDLGDIRTLSLPERFKTPSVVVQCVGNGKRAYYQIVGAADSVCELKTCAVGDVSLCDRAVPVAVSLPVGGVTRVVVPSSLLVPSAGAPSFSVRCGLVEGRVQYEVADTASVSCNLFSCQPEQLSICGGVVAINRVAALGEVLNLKTDLNQPVTVQCLGSGARAPRFVVINNHCN